MKTFREWLKEGENKEVNESKVTDNILSIVKEIIDVNNKLQDKAEKLNQLYRKETGTSNGVLNDYVDSNLIPSKSNLEKLYSMFATK